MSFWSESNWGLRFGVRDKLHPAGHRGLDRPCAAHEAIPTYAAGTVVAVQRRGAVLGNNITIRIGFLRYIGFCHLLVGSFPSVGAKVYAGQVIGKAAGPNDFHGSAWAGTHCHTTYGPLASSIYFGIVWDPAPLIRKKLAGVTPASTGTTIPVTKLLRRSDMPKLCKQTKKTRNGKNVFTTVKYFRVDVPDQVIEISKAQAKTYNLLNGYVTCQEVSDATLADLRGQAASVALARAAAIALANHSG